MPADDSFFREKVVPILEKHCVSCHQGQKPKGELSLTSAANALRGGSSGPCIEPGKPDESLLIEFVSGDKPEMPRNAPALAAEQVNALRKWIEDGARWPENLVLADRKHEGTSWWSLEPLVQAKIPSSGSPWVRTPVDAFVLAELSAQQLAPSPEADKRTLLRRLKFDLHGLPPTPEEIERFLSDTSPNAYEDLVDRLLASPRYGERWGRHWLDVVHFGESHGYDKDKPRPHAWPYRDYVIGAFNEDKPYSRFVEEQLAGDLLYPDDPQAIVATGFLAAGPWDFVGHVELREGTADKQIARSNDRDDMVSTAMSTFLSLTVHCARCHDHKFDPIKQEDYYRLQAVFAGVDRGDRPYEKDAETLRRRRELADERRSLTALQDELRARVAEIKSPEIEQIDARLEELRQKSARLSEAGSAEKSPTLGYHSQVAANQDTTKWVQIDLGRAVAVDHVILTPAHVKYAKHPGPGFGFPHRFRVEVSDEPAFEQAKLLEAHTDADVPNPGDSPFVIAGRGTTGRYLRVTATRLWNRTDDWIFALAELQVLSNEELVSGGAEVQALDSVEANQSWGKKNLVDGFASLAKAAGASETVETAQLETRRRQLVDSLLDPELRRQLADVDGKLKENGARLKELPDPSAHLVYASTAPLDAQGIPVRSKEPRPVHLLQRGDVKTPGPLMSPGALSCLRELPHEFRFEGAEGEAQRRGALAKWLTDSRNVLLRRSIVNRVWQYHFGRGLVDTPNDFGKMGSLPTHPELLDWLAQWFRSEGESMKELHRLIVRSAVYRQSSGENPQAAEIDSANHFLSRMNRGRLDAESIRDAVLQVSGKLDLTMGGPSVQQFYFKDDHSPIYDYERFDVDDPKGNRRSVYRFLVRSVPDPFMDCLDCADPSILTPKRNTTLTAIQALALLNNAFMVRQAEHFAERVRSLATDPREQIQFAYLLALGRNVHDDERQPLMTYLERHGLANLCRLIFNSNEFVFID